MYAQGRHPKRDEFTVEIFALTLRWSQKACSSTPRFDALIFVQKSRNRCSCLSRQIIEQTAEAAEAFGPPTVS
jgi:hypothetical protein